MGFALLDYLIVGLYLLGVVYFGIRSRKNQSSVRSYFLGGKEMSWWSVGFSIVASETSTLTFISIPGLAYKSDMHFLQVALGYFIGRLLVSVVFIPAYYRGNLETAYDFLGKRFGQSLRKFTSSVFIVTRVLASGVRLFATAIPVHLITGLSYANSILLIGAFTLVYTYVGGLKAVVMTESVQVTGVREHDGRVWLGSLEEPAIAVLDLQIGSMGGMAVTMGLRLDESAGALLRVPVLMLLDRQADVHLAKRCDADGWLIKPLDALSLKRAAMRILQPAPEPAEEPMTAQTAEEEPAPAG